MLRVKRRKALKVLPGRVRHNIVAKKQMNRWRRRLSKALSQEN